MVNIKAAEIAFTTLQDDTNINKFDIYLVGTCIADMVAQHNYKLPPILTLA